MTPRVFVTGAGIAHEALASLAERGCEVAFAGPHDSAEELARRVSDFGPDALIVRAGPVTDEVMASAPGLRVLCKHGVGVDNIDVAAATRRGLPVLFTPHANTQAVAEHALALILALLRRVPLEDRRLRGGVFDKRGYRGAELRGKTLGLIGYGRSGRRLAQLAGAFDARVVAYHPSRTAGDTPHVVQAADPHEVYAACDILSLHCPLTDQTRGMIDSRAFAQMKDGAYLVNTARGAIVREDHLLEALEAGRLAGAALDVFEHEPPDLTGPLFRRDDVIFTPHVAGLSGEAAREMGLASVRAVLGVLDGQRPPAEIVVNPEVFAGG